MGGGGTYRNGRKQRADRQLSSALKAVDVQASVVLLRADLARLISPIVDFGLSALASPIGCLTLPPRVVDVSPSPCSCASAFLQFEHWVYYDIPPTCLRQKRHGTC